MKQRISTQRASRAPVGKWGRGRAAAVVPVILLLCGLTAGAAPASAETATYSATQTIPVPPASDFAGSGGGDGWAVALSESAVYNVFHHQSTLQVACHLQTNATACFSPETIRDSEGHDFSTSGQPGLYLDQQTGKLYVYATRTSDSTAGVVCIDTTIAVSNPDPFCGFTTLTPSGEAPLVIGISGTSAPMLIGHNWYAFSYSNGVGQSGAKNTLLCFDVSTDAACAGQPFAVSIGSGTVTDSEPSPATAVIGTKVVMPLSIGGENRLACFDDATDESCAGHWPVKLGAISYAGVQGAPFPLLSGAGTLTGLCIPTGTDQCFNLEGEATATPAGMGSVITASSPWNGPALALGPRIYVPNGTVNGSAGVVQCFDYSTDAGCSGFPKSFGTSSELSYLYTVNADPQRPTCIWVNANGGTHQIQNFDAYTGQACGQGVIRALASQFVVPTPQCRPLSYESVQVVQPPRTEYTSGTVAFDDGDGNAIPGLPERTLDETGAASLAGMELNTPTGLPQFLFTLTGGSGKVGAVEMKLTWTGSYASECVGAHTTVVPPSSGGTTKEEAKPVTHSTISTPQTIAVEMSCYASTLQLVDVDASGGVVHLLGEAQRSLVGHTVDIRFLASGRTVATAVVAPDGSFRATAPLPRASIRYTNAARYRAISGSSVSLPLKLYRRMSMTSVRLAAGRVYLAGHVSGSFRAGTRVRVLFRVPCTAEHVIGTTVLGKRGRFAISLLLPAGVDREATYRAQTNVLLDGRVETTYTLPTPPGR